MTEGYKTGGRTKGVPNRSTALAREAIGRFIDGNVDRLQGWLDEIAEQEGAVAALRCFCDLIEYHVPKLARMELTGKDGEPLTVKVVAYAGGTAQQLDAAVVPDARLGGNGTGLPPSRPVLAAPKR
jgi:hypothetical protein